VFTPKGDLFKLHKGATVLDFAFQIHTNVGSHCSGGKVNGKNVPMRTKLQSGDQVEILTSQSQLPKRDWLNYAVTTKARTKIRQSISEQEMKTASFAKETIERKFKNKKIEYDEPVMMRLITRLGYKHVTEFYKAIAEEVIDVNTFIDRYIEALKKEHETPTNTPIASADTYVANTNSDNLSYKDKDILVIDKNIKGVEYSLAKCCNPIYGDDVFGFVTINRGIKIHRSDCPNAQRLKENLGYRVIPARWAGKGNSQYPITLRIIGHDDIGIVNNLTSIIAKEKNVMLRSIDIKSSEDGLFAGTLTIMIENTNQLNQLVKKLRTVKGVKNLNRL
jgi:GTP pyrophosphokinase